MESVAQRISALGLEVSKALAEVSDRLMQEMKQQVQDVAVKAMEGSPERKLAHIHQIAMEQAKNRPRG